jgi:tRNA pseudouridine55 synthase
VDGVLVVDKPAGITSHDVVDSVRRRLGATKVGHGGTLDPDATGVLVIGVGRATRFLEYSQRAPKRYVARARFGVTTTTQDASGEPVDRRPTTFDRAELERATTKFVGDIDQVPPMVSAVKVGGERLYKKARRGEVVVRAPRRVTVYELEVIDFRDGEEPEATLAVRCSAGTYVRTLVHDLGAALGTGGHVTELRRTEAGGFAAGEALAPADVSSDRLLPLVAAVRGLPQVAVDEAEAGRVANGRPLAGDHGVGDGELAAIVKSGELLAVYRRQGPGLVADRVVPR